MTPPKQDENQPSRSFAPLIGQGAHTLVLGTMPGQKSLQAQQYYAHPRNALWPILCAIATRSLPSYDVHHQLSYEERCTLILDTGFALWDVLDSCVRPGSLDSRIERDTEQPNAIAALLAKHVSIELIVCNGQTSRALFKRHIEHTLGPTAPSIIQLPSTSPAMATLNLQAKHDKWRSAIVDVLP